MNFVWQNLPLYSFAQLQFTLYLSWSQTCVQFPPFWQGEERQQLLSHWAMTCMQEYNEKKSTSLGPVYTKMPSDLSAWVTQTSYFLWCAYPGGLSYQQSKVIKSGRMCFLCNYFSLGTTITLGTISMVPCLPSVDRVIWSSDQIPLF